MANSSETMAVVAGGGGGEATPAAEAIQPATQPATPSAFQILDDRIYEALRDLLETDDSPADLRLVARVLDTVLVPNAAGETIYAFKTGEPWKGLPESRVMAIFGHALENSIAGDVRVYVAPGLSVSGARDHLCFTFNKLTLGQTRESMSIETFVTAVAEELAEGFPDDEEDEEEPEGDDEGLVLACQVEDCANEPIYVCTCAHCTQVQDGEKFAACGSAHQNELGPIHLEEEGLAPIWTKRPAAAPAAGKA